jgi:hypothetical protein
MRVKDLGLYLLEDVLDTPPEIADNLQLAQPRQPGGKPIRHRRTQEFPLADAFSRGPRRVMFAACQQHRVPTQRPLLVDDGESTEHIAALQRGEWSRMCSSRITRVEFC